MPRRKDYGVCNNWCTSCKKIFKSKDQLERHQARSRSCFKINAISFEGTTNNAACTRNESLMHPDGPVSTVQAADVAPPDRDSDPDDFPPLGDDYSASSPRGEEVNLAARKSSDTSSPSVNERNASSNDRASSFCSDMSHSECSSSDGSHSSISTQELHHDDYSSSIVLSSQYDDDESEEDESLSSTNASNEAEDSFTGEGNHPVACVDSSPGQLLLSGSQSAESSVCSHSSIIPNHLLSSKIQVDLHKVVCIQSRLAQETLHLGSLFYLPPTMPSLLAPRLKRLQKIGKEYICNVWVINHLQSKNCPLGSFQYFHSEIHQAKKSPKWKTVLKNLRKVYDPPKLRCTSINLPTGIQDHPYKKADVHHFDFSEQLIDLLSDISIFGDINNLVVNQTPSPSLLSHFDGDVEKIPKGMVHFWPYENAADDRLDEVFSALWYREAIDRLQVDASQGDFLLPIVIYMDKTGTDAYQRYSLEPVTFTTPLIRRHCRNHPTAWRPLGFVPDLDLSSTAQKEAARSAKGSQSLPLRNYHSCLEVLFEKLIQAQKQPIVSYLRCGEYVRLVRLICPVAYIIGDAKSADALCGRYGGHNAGISRLCRACFVSQRDADKVFRQPCKFVEQRSVCRIVHWYLRRKNGRSHVDKQFDDRDEPSVDEDSFCYSSHSSDQSWAGREQDRLRSLSTHDFIPAPFKLSFGGDPRGVFGATPTDLMHCFQLGILKYVVTVLIGNLTSTSKSRLDLMVSNIRDNLRMSESTQFPTSSIARGVSNLTQKTASEWVGVTFYLTLAFLTDRGCALLEEVFCSGSRTEKAEEIVRSDNVNAIRQLLECLLCFEAWYKVGPFWQAKDTSDAPALARNAIATMLHQVKLHLPRSAGCGYKLQKFHEHFHVVDDINRFGCPANYDAGVGESHLRYAAKQPSMTSQKITYQDFSQQVNKRVSELLLIRSLIREFENLRSELSTSDQEHYFPSHVNPYEVGVEEVRTRLELTSFLQSAPASQADEQPIQGAVGNVSIKLQTVQLQHTGGDDYRLNFEVLQDHWISSVACTHHHRKDTFFYFLMYELRFLHKNKSSEHFRCRQTFSLILFSEYTNNSGVRFRAHFNYLRKGPTYDWALVDFRENSRAPSSQKQPVHGHGFYPCKILFFFQQIKDFIPGTDATSTFALIHCSDRWVSKMDSVLTERWRMELCGHDCSFPIERRLRPLLRVVPVASMRERLYVFDPLGRAICDKAMKDERDEHHVMLIKDRRKFWPPEFVEFAHSEPPRRKRSSRSPGKKRKSKASNTSVRRDDSRRRHK